MSLLDGIWLVYPSCDDDIFATKTPVDTITRVARWHRSISISTKARLSETVLAEIARINSELLEHNSVIKISISASTRFRIDQIERGTASFEERLDNLRLLQSYDIPSGLVLKPLLSDEPINSYVHILKKGRIFTNNLLLGDEYLDQETKADTNTRYRQVNWLPSRPVWPVRENEQLKHDVTIVAQQLGYRVFDNDVALVNAILQEQLLQHRRTYDCQRDHHNDSRVYSVYRLGN
jgi:DNA repair photolyase